MRLHRLPSRISSLVLLLIVWLLETGASAQDRPAIEIVPNIPHSGGGDAVAFSPDGPRLLSGGGDFGKAEIKLGDAASGQLLRTFAGHDDEVHSVAFSPDGTRVLSGSSDKTLKLWDAASGQLLRTFAGHTEVARSVAFSPDGTRVLSGSSDNTLKLW